jgi:hypothetical protein
MPDIEISEECRVLIEGAAEPIRQTGRRLPNYQSMLKRGSGWRSCGGNANRSPTASSASSSSLSTGAACDSRTFGLWPLTAIQDGIFSRRPVALI